MSTATTTAPRSSRVRYTRQVVGNLIAAPLFVLAAILLGAPTLVTL